MGRKSTISQLPLPVRKAIDDALKTGRFTLDGILAVLRSEFQGTDLAKDAESVKRSNLGRYSQRFEEIGKDLRESREIAAIWADRLGKEPQGDIGKLVMDLLRDISFRATVDLSAREFDKHGNVLPIDVTALNKLALSIHRLETAGRHNLERETAMRKAVLAEAAESAESTGREAGLSDEAIKKIRDKIMMGMSG